ncbi:MAG: hypothetical protein Q7J27_02565 [Syntrophales bacterium]|nr:hypothetical protein [Syntrophales bacterium]
MPEQGNTFIIMDGIELSLPKKEEVEAFNAWLEKNGDRDPFNPAQHYDLLGAFRAGINRTDTKGNFASFNNGGHLPDTFKLPGHPTFSIESKYYKKGMPAGRWEGEKYIPINRPARW